MTIYHSVEEFLAALDNDFNDPGENKWIKYKTEEECPACQFDQAAADEEEV